MGDNTEEQRDEEVEAVKNQGENDEDCKGVKEDLRTRMELIERGTQTFLPILFDGDTTFDNERIKKIR